MNSRFKNRIGRIYIELVFNRNVVRQEGSRLITTTTALARQTCMRPSILVDLLREMETLGYIKTLHIDYRTITLELNR